MKNYNTLGINMLQDGQCRWQSVSVNLEIHIILYEKIMQSYIFSIENTGSGNQPDDSFPLILSPLFRAHFSL